MILAPIVLIAVAYGIWLVRKARKRGNQACLLAATEDITQLRGMVQSPRNGSISIQEMDHAVKSNAGRGLTDGEKV